LKSPDQERGLGLAGMNERALLLNGRLNIISSPGHGTKVELRIPLQPLENTNIHTPSDSSV
jgi:two-component system, NarL family, sensor histidine kinase UhpB